MSFYGNNSLLARRKVSWTPAQFGSNLALWLDANDASTISLSGSAVSQWRDKSGNGRHVAQAVTANQPTYQATGFNGRPTVSFNGNSWLFNLSVAALLRNATGGSLTAVANYTNANNTPDRWVAGVVNSLNTARAAAILLPSSLLGAGGRRVDSDAFSRATSATAYTNGTSIIQNLSLDFAGNNVSQFVNGSAAGTSTFPSGGGNSSDLAAKALSVGCYTVNGINPASLMLGLISGVVITHGVLSTTDRQRLEGYLAHRWGMTANLPADHPFKNAPPTI